MRSRAVTEEQLAIRLMWALILLCLLGVAVIHWYFSGRYWPIVVLGVWTVFQARLLWRGYRAYRYLGNIDLEFRDKDNVNGLPDLALSSAPHPARGVPGNGGRAGATLHVYPPSGRVLGSDA